MTLDDVNLEIKRVKVWIIAKVEAIRRRKGPIFFEVDCAVSENKRRVREKEEAGCAPSFIKTISRASMEDVERKSFATFAKLPEIAMLSFRIVVTSILDSG